MHSFKIAPNVCRVPKVTIRTNAQDDSSDEDSFIVSDDDSVLSIAQGKAKLWKIMAIAILVFLLLTLT